MVTYNVGPYSCKKSIRISKNTFSHQCNEQDKTIHRKIFRSSFLGYLCPQNWKVFNCYLLSKHPPIGLHEKTFQFYGKLKRNSPKIKRGKFEYSLVFSDFLGCFSQILHKIEQFFHAVLYRGLFFNR